MDGKEFETIRTDVVVAGGGTAGLCAAIQAARCGNDVVLLEMTDRLGGVMSICEGMPLGCGYPCLKNIGGLFQEYVDKLMACDPPAGYLRVMPRKNFGWDIYYNQDMAMHLFFEMLEEAGVHVKLNAITGDAHMDGNRIAGLTYYDRTGAHLVRGKVYIDCTGNGDVAFRAGVPYEQGNEKGEYMTYTMSFILAGADSDKVIDPADGENGYMDTSELIAMGVVAPELKRMQFSRMVEPGRFFVNFLRERGVDGLNPDDMLKRSNEARRKIIQIFQYIRKHVPGFENAYLDGVGPLLGIRDTRRFEGMYRLTKADILSGEKFPESGIVCCDNPIDEVGRGKQDEIKYLSIGEKGRHYYRVPFPCFVPKKVENLLFAGKLISSEPMAMASVRGMGTCFAMGQAVGFGANAAIKESIPVQKVSPAAIVKEMQRAGVIGLGDEKLV